MQASFHDIIHHFLWHCVSGRYDVFGELQHPYETSSDLPSYVETYRFYNDSPFFKNDKKRKLIKINVPCIEDAYNLYKSFLSKGYRIKYSIDPSPGHDPAHRGPGIENFILYLNAVNDVHNCVMILKGQSIIEGKGSSLCRYYFSFLTYLQSISQILQCKYLGPIDCLCYVPSLIYPNVHLFYDNDDEDDEEKKEIDKRVNEIRDLSCVLLFPRNFSFSSSSKSNFINDPRNFSICDPEIDSSIESSSDCDTPYQRGDISNLAFFLDGSYDSIVSSRNFPALSSILPSLYEH